MSKVAESPPVAVGQAARRPEGAGNGVVALDGVVGDDDHAAVRQGDGGSLVARRGHRAGAHEPGGREHGAGSEQGKGKNDGATREHVIALP
jgi:hypothetical protein